MTWDFGGDRLWEPKSDKPIRPCPLWGGESDRIIYYGLPVKLCKDTTCSCVFGFWDWIVDLLPNNVDEDGVGCFAFMVYHPDDTYLTALWAWLKGEHLHD